MGLKLVIGSFCLLYACHKFVGFWRAIQSIKNHPGHRLIFSLDNIIGSLLPKIKYLSLGRNSAFLGKHDPFVLFGSDIYSVVSISNNIQTTFVLADAAAIKEVAYSRARFPKPVHHYKALTFYGRNIVASEGDEWKTYRKISAPAFSNRNNKLVWDETLQIMEGLFAEVWENKDVISVDHFLETTMLLGSGRFGKKISWTEDGVTMAPGHQMSFKEALHVVTTNFIIKIVVPKLSSGEQKPEFSNITSPKQTIQTYENMPQLTYCLAVFYEALRLFPPATTIPKISAEDTTLTTVDINGGRVNVPVPKGCHVSLSAVGLHYNPRYWEDPHAFKPERFLGVWPRDAFLPFSSGARACLGKKFAETEGIAILTMLISRYKITIKEEASFAGETFEERKERVLSTRRGMTITPVRMPLTFTRRT
ncbi:unnamed protein product [Cyclocybe aegerita]|uniref:Cytochrome P450 n=1 Tax=Cyclocybe aegerita TaxID=1973307 RepID=A0A8S0W8W7_CYCAE|nr:unnamed protein product [Cyclocybe aegerita]